MRPYHWQINTHSHRKLTGKTLQYDSQVYALGGTLLRIQNESDEAMCYKPTLSANQYSINQKAPV